MASLGATTIYGALTVGSNRVYETNVIKKTVFKDAVPDNSATTIFTIRTTNEASNDGGTYACFVKGVIAHPGTNADTSQSSKAFSACFTRSMLAAGTGANSAVSEIVESASAATSSADRDISTVTMTVVETSEFVQSIQFLVDTTGTSATTAKVYLEVEVIYTGFTTPPVIASA